MSTTMLDLEIPRREGFPTQGRSLVVTRFAARGGELGCQLTIGGESSEFHQYVTIGEGEARRMQAALDEIFGPRDA